MYLDLFFFLDRSYLVYVLHCCEVPNLELYCCNLAVGICGSGVQVFRTAAEVFTYPLALAVSISVRCLLPAMKLIDSAREEAKMDHPLSISG